MTISHTTPRHVNADVASTGVELPHPFKIEATEDTGVTKIVFLDDYREPMLCFDGNAALALAYRRRGARIFPCREDRFGLSAEFPKGDPEAKKPYPGVMWQGPEPGQLSSIEAWWRQWPDALVGVGLGDANLVVIDVDGGEAGVAAWEAYALEQGGLPDETPVVITPTDGRHYFFRLPDGVKHGNSRGGLPKKAELPVDVRGTESGYVIACGTERPSHGFYLPDNGDTFAWLRAPLIPDWLLAVLKGQREHGEASQAPATTLPAIILPPDVHAHPQGQAWIEGAFNDEIAGVSSCPCGGRNEQLNRAAFSLGTLVGGNWLAESTVVSALEQACRDCGLWKDDGPAQCRKTINSGLSKGKLDPRPLPANIAETLELERLGAELQRTLIINEDGTRTDVAMGEVLEADDPWPVLVPITSSLPSVLPLTRDMLPPAIGNYVLDVAERQQSPADFAAVAALCGLATIVGNRVRVKPKQFDDWMVVPTLWGAIIGKPSAMKSPAMKAALAPIYTLESEALKEWEEQCEASRLDISMASIDAKNARSAAEKAARLGQREEAMRLIAEHSQNAARIAQGDPPCPRLFVNSSTVEKLGELLKENPGGLLVIRDELAGLLTRMGQEEYAEERAFYLTAFNGDDSFIYDRIGRGTVRIANCTLSFIGGIQPARIAPLVRGALTGKSDDGLIQRLQLAVWPDDQKDWEWVDRTPDGPARERYLDLFRRVRLGVAEYQDEPAIFSLDAEALDLFRGYSEAIHREARGGNLSPTLESHILKQPKTVVSLALIFQLAIDGRRHLIEAEAMHMALRWAVYLRSHANRLYAAGGVVAEDGARLILERRAQLPAQFTARRVHQKDWAGLTDADAVDAAINVLVATGHCRPMPAKPGPAGPGRPTKKYEWRPDLPA